MYAEIIIAVLIVVVIGIASAIFARRGEVGLIRKLIVELVEEIDSEELFEKLASSVKRGRKQLK